MIVFFHGFAATGQGSSKAALLRSFFAGRTQVVTPTYPCGDPRATFALLGETVRASARAGASRRCCPTSRASTIPCRPGAEGMAAATIQL